MSSYSMWTIQTSCPCFFYEKSYWHLKSWALFLSLKVDWHLRATEGLVFSRLLLNWSFHKSVQGEKTGYILQNVTIWMGIWKSHLWHFKHAPDSWYTLYIVPSLNREKDRKWYHFRSSLWKRGHSPKGLFNWNGNTSGAEREIIGKCAIFSGLASGRWSRHTE